LCHDKQASYDCFGLLPLCRTVVYLDQNSFLVHLKQRLYKYQVQKTISSFHAPSKNDLLTQANLPQPILNIQQ